MRTKLLGDILGGVLSGDVVPYLGPGVLGDVTSFDDGSPIPADDTSLIMAMTGGRHLSPKLMEEFPRAAMHFELKKGRKFLSHFLTMTYGNKPWTGGAVHEWLASLSLPYIIDTNRDTRLQELYAGRPHTLVSGVARIVGSDYRFRLWESDGSQYRSVTHDEVNASLPVLFKPHGTPLPEPTYIASDADYVDYITELMGGFAIPGFAKLHRQGKKYLVAGLRLRRDTQRMVLSELIADSHEHAGWVFIEEPTSKERRYCATKGLEVVEADFASFLEIADRASVA
ncbi:SIR2 family protein [Aquisphaera insulae]|uniref:SIR2 family protein n=1 Tax=Aquisphaera insulae TaxID=2712864 RepID=UPI0013EC2533|nr:SIR2 family protein [Aquisphaera insulae]